MRILYATLIGLLSLCSYGQREFKEYENGLIYSPIAVSKLAEIVGVENEKFRQCDLSKTYKAHSQTTGYIFKVKAGRKKQLLKSIQNSMTLEEFKAKYAVDEGKEVLLVKTEYESYEGDSMVNLDIYVGYELSMKKAEWNRRYVNNWIVEDMHEGVMAIYTPKKLWNRRIPFEYARQIQYAECLIDTNTRVHPEKAPFTGARYPERGNRDYQKQFFDYVHKNFAKEEPQFETYDNWEVYEFHRQNYQEELEQYVTKELSQTKKFQEYLRLAIDEALEQQNSTGLLEWYAENFISKKSALELKRSRIVVGMCSQDSSPRFHAMNIAQLSAESYSWDVFLRAHLDILNDNFRRSSDGSYAWAGRNTYIRELEVLQIDVPDLLMGITFRATNVSKNHYFGNIRRLGRAIAESEEVEQFVSKIETAVKDEQLDDYNRILMFYLYANVQYNLDRNEDRVFNTTIVEALREQLPSYLHELEY